MFLQVQLVGPVGPRMRDMLHKSIRVPASSLQEHDEFHLILEYQVKDQWGSSTCPVATRFITSHDETNGLVQPLEAFFETVKLEVPDLIVLSGLHMLDGQSWQTINSRIEVLLAELEGVPPQIPVHLELASMVNQYLIQSIVEQVRMVYCSVTIQLV